MNPAQLTAAAQQANTQGQQLLSQDQANSSQSQGQYSNYSNQANQAAQQAQAQAQYMQGAGSGQNIYNTQLQQQEQAANFNPAQLQSANQNLFGLSGALNGVNQQFNSAGAFGGANGLTGSQIGSYESSILNPLQAGVSNANTQVGTLNSELGNLGTLANQATTSGVQTEQGALTGFTQAAAAYQTQAAAALQNMQFYSQLAQQQGGLNAQQQQSYATAIQGYTQAAAAMKQAQAAATTAAASAALEPSQANLNTQQAALAKSGILSTTPTTTTSTPKVTVNNSPVLGSIPNGLQGAGVSLQ